MGEPLLSVIVPAYNEVQNLPELLERLHGALEGIEAEVLVVDDGSTDSTPEVLLNLASRYPELRSIRLSERSGQTAATYRGVKEARGRYLATLDVDLQNDPEDLRKLLPRVEEADVICGYRVGRQDNFLRRASSAVARWVRHLVIGDSVIDIGCSLRIVKRSCLEDFPWFQGMHRFLPAILEFKGYRILQVPVRHHPRRRGESKYGIANRVFKATADLLAVYWMKRRLIKGEKDG